MDLLIVTAQRKGDYGVDAINNTIQELINNSSLYIKHGNTTFKMNDKVMQTKNNYSAVEIVDGKEREGYIFNGNIGLIIDISEEEVLVKFDDKIIKYDKD